jgi:hypothetical protein
MANYNSTIYSGSLRDKSLEVANTFTGSGGDVWDGYQDWNTGVLGMYDWIPSDGELYLAEINTHLRMRNIDTNWVDFDALNVFLSSSNFNKLVVCCDNTTVGVKPQDGFLTHLSSSLSSAGIEYEKQLVDPYPIVIPPISGSDDTGDNDNVFVMKIAYDGESPPGYLSANKLDFNNHVSSSGMYSYQPRKYVDLPATHSNGAGVPDVVVKESLVDLKRGLRFLDLNDDTTGSLSDYVDEGYVVEEYIVPDTIVGSLQTDVLRGLVLHTTWDNLYLTSDSSDLRGYSSRKTPVASGSNEYIINYVHNPDTFVEGTSIRMHDGSSKDVEDIQIGDIVSSYNIPGMPEDTVGPPQLSNLWSWTTSSIASAELTSSVVTGYGSDVLDQYYLINDEFKIGEGGSLFVKSGSEYSFNLPADVETGMKLLNSSEEEINIDSISLVSEKTTFYSLDVEEIDTYFGSDILVHNLPPCFVGGTQIQMHEGVKSIEEVEIGDIVKSFDVGTSSVVDSKVTKTYVHTDRYYMILNGNIKTTSVHPFYTDGKWIEAGDLSIGDKILHVDGLEHTIETIELSDEQVTVYNFEVDGTHNYYAEGYLVHNK